jgi:hypothetical protein
MLGRVNRGSAWAPSVLSKNADNDVHKTSRETLPPGCRWVPTCGKALVTVNFLTSGCPSIAWATRRLLQFTRPRAGLINPYPARQAASIVTLAAVKVDWVSRAILPLAIRLRSLAFRVVVE